MKKNIKWKNLKKLKFIFINLLFLCINNIPKTSKNIVFSIENSSKNQKYWVGGKYEIIINKFLDNNNEKIFLKSSNNKVVELSNRYILMKSNGRECLTVYTRSKKINSRICINKVIYEIANKKFSLYQKYYRYLFLKKELFRIRNSSSFLIKLFSLYSEKMFYL